MKLYFYRVKKVEENKIKSRSRGREFQIAKFSRSKFDENLAIMHEGKNCLILNFFKSSLSIVNYVTKKTRKKH